MSFMRFARTLIGVCLAVLIIVTPFRNKIVHADDDDKFEFTGIISALPNTSNLVGDWTVAGRTVHVTAATEIERDGGDPAVGKIAEIEGTLNNDGSVSATEIEIKAANNFEFRGRVDQLP